MSAEIIKFPFSVARRAHSRKPRWSKNGSPEERAAKKAAEIAVLAEVVDLSEIRTEAPIDKVDRRKLRGNPLRGKMPQISFAVTLVGRMHTADLKGEPLPDDAGGWLEELLTGAANARRVADELDEAHERLRRHQRELPPDVMTPKEFREAYERAPPHVRQIIADKIDAFKRERSKSTEPEPA